jgi:hypothetical protein
MVELVKILNTIMNGSGESGHTFLVLDLRRKAFSSSLLSIMLAMGFFFVYQVEKALFYSQFSKYFDQERFLDFSNAFSVSTELII